MHDALRILIQEVVKWNAKNKSLKNLWLLVLPNGDGSSSLLTEFI